MNDSPQSVVDAHRIRLPRFYLRTLFILVVFSALALSCCFYPTGTAVNPGEPILALWTTPYWTASGEVSGPNLRFAFWEDGRCVFATSAKKWGGPLAEGVLTTNQVRKLKQDIAKSGVSRLDQRSYLVPDSDCYYLSAVAGGRKHLLAWDEHIYANYGISVNSGPNEHAFMQCWKSLCEVAQSHIPTTSKPSNFVELTTRRWE